MMKVFFVFSGQGAQSAGMGKDLCNQNEAAAKIFSAADKVLGWSVSEICFNGPEEKLTESRYCQPAIYTMSCAALCAFKNKYPAITPIACAGLSLGEYAALFAAGVFSFEDGLKLIARRAELMDAACRETNGGMASVLGGEETSIRQVCDECGIDVANFNSPGQIVISGEKEKVDAAVLLLKERGMKKVIPLKVAGAYHSRLMKNAGTQLRQAIDTTTMNTPVVPVFQNFTGIPAATVSGIRDNLEAQVAGSVRWEQCIKGIAGIGGTAMIEFGPGNVLTGLLKRIDASVTAYNINSIEGLEAFSSSQL